MKLCSVLGLRTPTHKYKATSTVFKQNRPPDKENFIQTWQHSHSIDFPVASMRLLVMVMGKDTELDRLMSLYLISLQCTSEGK
jgi:hypothetical protein